MASGTGGCGVAGRGLGRLLALGGTAAALLGAAVAGCGGDDTLQSGPITVAPKPRGVLPPKPSDLVDAASGLKRGDLWTFRHGAAGSELLLLGHLSALDDAKTGKPFLINLERYGLIPDPEPNDLSPMVLPVGLGVARSRDLRFANVQMAAVTCAACHAGTFEAPGRGPAVRVDGAPGSFDAGAFYGDLAASVEATAASPAASWAFLGRLYKIYRYEPPAPLTPPAGGGGGFAKKADGAGKAGQAKKGFAAKKKGGGAGKGQAKAKARTVPPSAPRLMFFGWSASPQEIALLGAPLSTARGMGVTSGLAGLPQLYPDLSELRDAGVAEHTLAGSIERLHREESARPAPDLAASLVTDAPKGPLADYLAALDANDLNALGRSGPALTEAAAALRAGLVGALPTPEVDVRPVPSESVEPGGATSGAYPGSAPVPTSALASAPPEAVSDLLRHYAETVRLLRARVAPLKQLAAAARGAGPGRVDALGPARARLVPAYGKTADAAPAPVRFPSVWGARDGAWSLYDGSTNSALGRDVTHLIGAGGVLLSPKTAGRAGPSSTLDIPSLARLDALAVSLKPPVWPEALFGKVDAGKAARGKTVFAERCASCHAADPDKAPKPLPLDEVGTDPARARAFAVAETAAPLADAVRAVVTAAGGKPPEADAWRATETYVARPLTAVWATAPYLHNGSVPTIDALLRPEADRPKTFPVGRRVYDPARLGFTTDPSPEAPARPEFPFDTTKPGNSNKGHSGPKFGTDLSDADRAAVLEYLKTPG